MELTRRELLATSLAALSSLALADHSEAAGIRQLKNGVDISWLPDVEAAGGKFYTTEGLAIDGIALLKKSGIKVGRLRVFVNPSTGNGDLRRAIALAKRLKALGMEVCVDLHYSDDWADPGSQQTPAEWPTNLADLELQVLIYTQETLGKFILAGIYPEWVQLGNEISNGFLWPLGHITSGSNNEWENFVTLHNAASYALRQTLPKAKSVLHLDCGGDPNRVRNWYQNAMQHGLSNFDVFGLSYYCQWQGSLDALATTLQVVSTELKKPVLIAETAYPWTPEKFGNDVIDTSTAHLDGYPQTPSGQSAYVSTLQKLVRSQPRNLGVGIWWWEGLATFVRSAGQQDLWNGGMANSALVDSTGKALPALKALKG
jgi:arabinogalactan endo-1,4-beta-galactosidase